VRITRVFIICMILVSAIAGGCGKKKEEAKPAPPVAPARRAGPTTPYTERLKAIAAKAAEEAKAADPAKLARAKELVGTLMGFDYTGGAYVPVEEVADAEAAKNAPYLVPPSARAAPQQKETLGPIVNELSGLGIAAVPALMDGYLQITYMPPRSQILITLGDIKEGRAVSISFLLEVLENDPEQPLRNFAGQALHEMMVVQGKDVKELADAMVPQLVAMALRTSDDDVSESALTEVYEFQIRGYALSAGIVETLQKALAGAQPDDVRAIMIARSLMEQGDEAGTAFLLKSLDYPQTPESMTVANWTLHLLGRKRVAAVAEAAEKFLKDKENVEGREEAAWVLGNLASDAALRERALRALSEVLKTEEDTAVYRQIAATLAQLGDPASVELLLGQAQDNEDPELRIQCVGALAAGVGSGAIKGEPAAKIVQRFLDQATKGENAEARMRYIRALADAAGGVQDDLRRKIIAQCVTMMGADPDPGVRAEAATALGMITDNAVTVYLLEALREEKDQYVKISIIRALARQGSDEAIRPLMEMLKTENRDLVYACADALSKLKGFKLDNLFDEYVSVGITDVGKTSILMCLRHMKDDEKRSIAKFLLEQALPAEKTGDRRREIIRDIGQRVPPGSPDERDAIKALLDVLKTSADTESLRVAIGVLAAYKNEDTIAPIIAGTKKSPGVRKEAVEALANIGQAREDVVQFFLDIAKEVNFANYKQYRDQVESVVNAINTLPKTQSARAAKIIMDRCRNEKDPNARRAALEMSLVIEDRGFDDYLIATMQNAQEPPEVRSGAILGLGLRKSHKAVPELIRLLTAPEGEIAVSAAYSLGAIGNKKGFRPLVDLLKRLQDAAPQNETLTEIVVFALQQMTGENRIGADHVGWEEWYAGHPQWRGSGK